MGDLVAYLRERVAASAEVDPRNVSDQTPLSEIGVTSLQLVELIAALEDDLGVILPADAITAESFRTVATLADVVRPLLTSSHG